MNNQQNNFNKLAKKIASITSTIPPDLILSMLPKLVSWDNQDWRLSSARAIENINNPRLKSEFIDLFTFWKKECPDVFGTAIALAINTSLVNQSQSQIVQTDIVWTGPESKALPFRRTDQALLELINTARENLLIVSFAVYKIKSIVDALEQACKRVATLKIVLEDPEESDGKINISWEKAFSQFVVDEAEFYTWPIERRPTNDDGKHGSLHAKVAMADSKRLFISSANLTEYAMSLNMEMGILVEGGELPKQVGRHFEELIITGCLTRILQ